MDSRDYDGIIQKYDKQAQNYADYAGISDDEARNRLSTVDPTNAYRHSIDDSYDGNGEGRRSTFGCAWLIVVPLFGTLLYGATKLLA